MSAKLNLNEKEIIRLYNKGKSANQMAILCNCSKNT